MNDLTTIVSQYLESIACCDFQKIKLLLHNNYQYTSSDGQVYHGPDRRFETAGMTLNTFPDLSFEIKNCYQSGNIIITELIMRGTHQGELMNFPTTANKLAIPACSILEISDGLILSEREYYDKSCLLQQHSVVDRSGQKTRLLA